MLIVISSISFPAAPQPCQESSLQLNFIDFTYTEYYIEFYSVRYCQSNTLSTVCSDGVTDEEAALFCQQNGYTRKLFSVLPEMYCCKSIFNVILQQKID